MDSAIYWIEGPWAGKLAIMARPRGGEWLIDEVDAWQKSGLDVIVSLLTSSENIELGLTQEPEAISQQGLHFLSFPIADRSIPTSFRETQKLVDKLTTLLSAGKNVGLHCRQGIGRSGLLTASVLAHSGLDVDTAFARVEAARGCAVPDTAEQRQWVERFNALEALSTI
jgi:protein-tyrosine phosphatase